VNAADVTWVSRVPETSAVAQAVVREEPASWQQSDDGQLAWWRRTQALPQGRERWLLGRSREGEQRARATLQRQAAREQALWQKRVWQLGTRAFACEADAQAACEREQRQVPSWLRTTARVVAVPNPRGPPPFPDRPTVPGVAGAARAPAALEREALRRAAFSVATTVLDAATRPERDVSATYKAQSAVERGFALLKDPLLLASAVFVKTPPASWHWPSSWSCACSSIDSPKCGCVRGWPLRRRRCRTTSAGRPLDPPGAGSSNALRGLPCTT
jgi:hypothetical protein